MANPFLFDRPLPPDALIDRDDELRLLADLAEAGQTARLAAIRRYGKTTLLGALATRLRPDWTVTYVDLSRVRGLEDAAVRLRDAWQDALRQSRRRARALTRRLGALEIQAGIGPVRVRKPPRRHSSAVEALHELLALPDEVSPPTLVIFDEFPDLLSLGGGLDGLVRSHIQHHVGRASYVFAGSQTALMTALFSRPSRPLYAQARAIDLPPLPRDELIEWLCQRDRRLPDEIAAEIADLTAGHPQRAMLVAHFLWEQPQRTRRDLESAVERALEEARPEIEQARDALTTAQRAVLDLAAGGERRLLSAAALQNLGLAKSTVQAARDALIERGLLRRLPEGGYRAVDPLLSL
jgi:uncharacterized protein